jgi:uncharacterized membrane protein YidH (DUF202 family)
MNGGPTHPTGPTDPTGSAHPAGGSAGGAPHRPELVGTQVERTELAWVRTSLACAGLVVLAVQLAFDGVGPAPGLAIGALVALPGLVAAWWRIRGLRTAPTPEPPRSAGVALLAGSVALVEVATLILLLR